MKSKAIPGSGCGAAFSFYAYADAEEYAAEAAHRRCTSRGKNVPLLDWEGAQEEISC